MTTAQLARTAYGLPQTPARNPRALEYDLLARASKGLTAAWARRRSDYPGLVAALDMNLQLWSTFGADVADPGNGLPPELRQRLFYLYRFTAQHSRAVMDGNASVDVLIDINTAIMRGLRGDGGGA